MKFTIKTVKGKVVVEGGGHKTASPFTTDKSFRDAAKLLGVPYDTLKAEVAKHRLDKSKGFEHVEAVSTPTYRVREIESSDVKSYKTFEEALRSKGKESVIEWDSVDEVAVLDVDWHGETKGPGNLDAVTVHTRPLPAWAWVSKNGGLHLVYKKVEDVPADVLAVVGAYRLLTPGVLDTVPSGVEIKSATRHPQAKPKEFKGVVDLDVIRGMFTNRTYSEHSRDEWLAERGLSMGGRYPHDKCPIAPGHKSQSPNPVAILDAGIYCHSCKGRLGRGLVEWAVVLGDAQPSKLLQCVDNLVHYDHAEFMLRTAGIRLPKSLIKPFYKAALTLVHGTQDKRVASVFADVFDPFKPRPYDLVRYPGYWGTLKGEVRKDRLLTAQLGRLPVAITKSGRVNDGIVDRLKDTASLDNLGYPALKRIRGARISTYHNDSPDGLPRIEIYDPNNTPRYIDPPSRLTEVEAWNELEKVYTGVNRPFVEMLVFCRSLIEWGRVSTCPIFVVQGGTETGKTGHFHLAAAICGDVAKDLKMTLDEGRMEQRLLAAMQGGSFVVINEVAKTARRGGMAQRDSLDFLLHITPTTTAHMLYVGPVEFGDMGVIGLTDIEHSTETLSDAQYARRCFHLDMGATRLKWKQQSTAYGLRNVWDIRRTENIALAADSLLSIWTDRYWPEGTKEAPLDDLVAASLGIKKLEAKGFADERAANMRVLFAEWLKAKPVCDGSSTQEAKYLVKGYKSVRVDSDSPLAIAWGRLHDEGDPMSWTRANESSWADVLGRARRMRLRVSPLRPGRKTYVTLSFEEQVDAEGDKWVSIK